MTTGKLTIQGLSGSYHLKRLRKCRGDQVTFATGNIMVDHSGAFMDQKKKCYDKMGLIPTQIMVAYLKINTFSMRK